MADPRLHILDDDVTSGFSVSRRRTTVGSRCMRRDRYVTARWSDEFVVRAEHDGTYINCSVVVPGLPVPVASHAAMLTVRCKQFHLLINAADAVVVMETKRKINRDTITIFTIELPSAATLGGAYDGTKKRKIRGKSKN